MQPSNLGRLGGILRYSDLKETHLDIIAITVILERLLDASASEGTADAQRMARSDLVLFGDSSGGVAYACQLCARHGRD